MKNETKDKLYLISVKYIKDHCLVWQKYLRKVIRDIYRFTPQFQNRAWRKQVQLFLELTLRIRELILSQTKKKKRLDQFEGIFT